MYFILGKSVSRLMDFIPSSIFLYSSTYFFFAASTFCSNRSYFSGFSNLWAPFPDDLRVVACFLALMLPLQLPLLARDSVDNGLNLLL